jgi:predicted GNAT family acetyltransferase
MEVKHETHGTKGVFYIEENGERIAGLTYVFSGDARFIIEHTEVNPGNEGKGLGKQLVNVAVKFARENDYKILPLCPYAKSVMERSDEYKDVLF